jgi:DNA repair protein RecN (Recombination protein N)
LKPIDRKVAEIPMLTSLHIENIAVIQSLDVDFSDGFTVMTGETGAGKSVIIDSIGLILGGKASKELVRTGEDHSMVSALFDRLSPKTVEALAEIGVYPDEDGCLYIQRTISAKDGRSVTKLGGHTIPLSLQKEIGAYLINVHGQHENQALLNSTLHIHFLDDFAKDKDLVAEYSQYYSEMLDAKKKMQSYLQGEREKQQRLDMLKFQIQDIESAKLKANEEEELQNEKKRLQNSKFLMKQITTIYRALYKNDKGVSAWRMLEIARKSLDDLAGLFPDAPKFSDKLYDMQYEMASIAQATLDYLPHDGDNPEQRLNEIEDRLDVIHKLERKYGSSETEVLDFLKNAKSELNDILLSDEKAKEYSILYEEAKSKAWEVANKLSEIRKSQAGKLSEKICSELNYLDMNKVCFTVKVTRRDQNSSESLSPSGCDDVEFLISTNPGDPLKSLTKIASGGELSRIMLAMKCVLTDSEGIPTIVFDEIDTGVSGKTSHKIGVKLRQLSRGTQVFCITHSAQVAANADNHYKIVKNTIQDRSVTCLELLNDASRADELARIMGGVEPSRKIHDSAVEMLELARSKKNTL